MEWKKKSWSIFGEKCLIVNIFPESLINLQNRKYKFKTGNKSTESKICTIHKVPLRIKKAGFNRIPPN